MYIYDTTLCPQNDHLFIFEEVCQKLTDFDNFWYFKS